MRLPGLSRMLTVSKRSPVMMTRAAQSRKPGENMTDEERAALARDILEEIEKNEDHARRARRIANEAEEDLRVASVREARRGRS